MINKPMSVQASEFERRLRNRVFTWQLIAAMWAVGYIMLAIAHHGC